MIFVTISSGVITVTVRKKHLITARGSTFLGMLFQLAGTDFHTTGKESIVSPYKKEHHRLKRCRLRKINMLDEPKLYIYLEPMCPDFSSIKEGQTSNQNKGPHLGYILFIKVFLDSTSKKCIKSNWMS